MPVTTTEPKFNCSTCGKEYRWKPELAGKKAKCKCGSVIAVPTKAPAAASPAGAKPAARPAPRPAEQEADLDGLYALAQEEKKATVRTAQVDEGAAGYRCPSCSSGMPPGALVCPSCNLDIRTGMRVAGAGGGRGGAAVMAAAGAYVTATSSGRGGAGVLPYGGGGRGAASAGAGSDKDVIWEGGKARSLYLPIGLIVLGLLFYFGQVAFANNKLSAGVMVGLVMGRVVMDSVLIFVSMLIAVRGFDMGFGAFGPGILKILAVAMGPGALGQMVEEMMGGGFGGLLVGALVTIVLYATLIKVLFNLDAGETLLLIFLIYGVRRVLGTFLFVALIGAASSGLISEEGAGAVGVGAAAVASAGEDNPYPPKRAMVPEELAGDLDKGAQASLRFNKGGTPPDQYFDLSDNNRFSSMDRPKSLALVKALEEAGAKNITCVSFHDTEGQDGAKITLVGGIVFDMPEEPAARKKVFDIRANLLKSLGEPEVMVQVEVGGKPDETHKEEPLKDWGQKYMVIHFGYDKNTKYFGQSRFEKKMKELEAQEAEEGKSDEAEEADGAKPEAAKPDAPDAPGDAPAEKMAEEKPADAAPADAPF
jgi:hypothetical protein